MSKATWIIFSDNRKFIEGFLKYPILSFQNFNPLIIGLLIFMQVSFINFLTK